MLLVRLRSIALILFLLGFIAEVQAQTNAKLKEAETQRLIPLEKLTIGPYDNYQSSVSTSNEKMVYTRKINLVPRVFIQNRNGSDAKSLLSLNVDSDQAEMSPDGEKIALTYYGNTARGQICIVETKGSKPNCITQGLDSNADPQWISNNEVAYRKYKVGSSTSQLILHNIESGAKKLILNEAFRAARLSLDKKYIVFLKSGSEGANIHIIRMGVAEPRKINLSIPGQSGFPRFSMDGKYIYFSHYLSDSNKDQVIDANDDSAIFRIATQEALKATGDIFPQQLTSQESNCSFPEPSKVFLFVTCAYQGSLDVYQAPLDGVIPSRWNMTQLWDAHASSRSYFDRLLILNALYFKNWTKGADDFMVRRISNHVLAENYSAAIDLLEGLKSAGLKKKFKALEFFVRSVKAEEELGGSEVTNRFRRFVGGLQRQSRSSGADLQVRKILDALYASLLRNDGLARKRLKAVRVSRLKSPEDVYLFFEVARRFYMNKADFSYQWVNWLSTLLNGAQLNSQARVYYLFQYMTEASAVLSDLEYDRSIRSLQNKISKIPESALIQSELNLLEMVGEEDVKKRNQKYKEFNGFVSQRKDDYFLMRAMFIRAVIRLAQAGQTDLLGFAATNWFNLTKKSQTEFYFARQQYIYAMLDQAYGNFHRGKIRYSTSQFYGSLLYTDDLESHYSYVVSMVKDGQRKKLDERYAFLQKRNFTKENYEFVKALLLILDTQGSKKSADALEDAYAYLDGMDANLNSSIRHLLMGWIKYQMVLASQSEDGFNEEYFSRSHKHLMLSLDLAQDNERIRSSALNNLGLLHFEAQNFGLSVEYFKKREAYSFESNDEEVAYNYFFARSLYYNLDAKKAYARLMALIDSKKVQGRELAIFFERAGFYAYQAGQFSNSANAYENFLQTGEKIPASEEVKLRLSYGYSLMKLGRKDQALTSFNRALNLSSQFKGDDQLRIRLILSGLIIRASQAPTQAQLDSNWQMLSDVGPKLGKVNIKPANWHEYRLRNRLYRLDLSLKTKKESRQIRGQIFSILDDFSDDLAGGLSNAYFQGLSEFVLSGIYSKDEANKEKYIDVLDEQLELYKKFKERQIVFESQRIKLLLLRKYLELGPQGFSQWFEKYSISGDPRFLIQKGAPRWQSLRSFAGVLSQWK